MDTYRTSLIAAALCVAGVAHSATPADERVLSPGLVRQGTDQARPNAFVRALQRSLNDVAALAGAAYSTTSL